MSLMILCMLISLLFGILSQMGELCSVHLYTLRTNLIKQNREHWHIHNAWLYLLTFGSKLLWRANMCLISPFCLCLSSHSISFGTGCVQCDRWAETPLQDWFSTGIAVALMPDSRGHSVWIGVSGEHLCHQMERVRGDLSFFSGCCFPTGRQAGSARVVLRKFTFADVSFSSCFLYMVWRKLQ